MKKIALPTRPTTEDCLRAETGASRSTIYLRIQQGLWPKPVRLGPYSVGWPASEVTAINAGVSRA